MRFRLFTRRSLRGKFFRVVLGVIVLPYALIALWLLGTVDGSSEESLRTVLDTELDQAETVATARWAVLRASLADIAEDSVVQAALLGPVMPALTGDATPQLELTARPGRSELAAAMVTPITVNDITGERRWRAVSSDLVSGRGSFGKPGIKVTVPVIRGGGDVRIGSIEVHVNVESLLPERAVSAVRFPWQLKVIDTAGETIGFRSLGSALLPRDARAMENHEVVVQRRVLAEPPITIVAMAMSDAYTVPFKRGVSNAALVILLVSFASLGIATLLTRRMTNSLESLAAATQAVASGDLDHRVREDTTDEVGRVGRAFNTMTESLRGTLRELSKRESLAAVGEFAAALSHEIRNPLTSIRIDLQRVQEKLPEDSALRTPLGRALREVDRLDHTVSGALRIARSGHIGSDLVDLRVPLQRAIEVAQASFDQRGGQLHEPSLGDARLPIRGDEAALEQLFLNILLNAAHAIAPGGEGAVAVQKTGSAIEVIIRDNGAGIPPERLASVFDPFYTTKSDGTGLGLAVARQIVAAHGGQISLDSSVGAGTSVVIRLPLAG